MSRLWRVARLWPAVAVLAPALVWAADSGAPRESPQPAPPSQATAADAQDQGWYTFNGDLEAQKFSPAAQITPENVHTLKEAWQFHTGDVADGRGQVPETYFEATPIFANDTVYIGTPFYRIFALAPDSGQPKWVFDPHEPLQPLTQPGMKSRGVAYWQAANPTAGACQKIVYIGTMAGKLHAVDADTGKPCAGFGAQGTVDVNQWNDKPGTWPLSLLQPPTVYKDTLLLGWAGKDWALSTAPSGTLLALDARTGALKWRFEVLPPEAQKSSGTANIWASLSVDPKAGIAYLPVSSPSPNFYGGNRKQPIPYATSVTALAIDTGKVIWSRQLVHHDLWDYDTNSAPTLVDIQKDGQTIPALVQSTKQGFLFVLNRMTGEPIYPVNEVPVPSSDVPGEQSAATQPEVPVPQPTVPARWSGISTLADITSGGSCSRMAKALRYDGRFTPPSVKGSLIYPSTVGGVEWGGGAVDPLTHTYIVNNSYVAQIYRLVPRQDYGATVKAADDPQNYFPQSGSPYGVHVANFTNWLGMPCWAPPYGSIAAYDLDTGRQLWKEPFGEVQKWGFYMPDSWGSVTVGAPLVTRSGLIFIGASMDSRVRALDLKSGKVLWKAHVDAPAVSIPATYTYKGKQYVVFTAGGNELLVPRLSDEVVAFALPS